MTPKRDAKYCVLSTSKYSTPSKGSLQTSTCDYYWRGQSSLACPWKARAAVHGIAWWWSGDVGLRVPGRVTRPPQPPPHNLKQKQRAWSLPRACLASLHPGPGHSALVGKTPIFLQKKEHLTLLVTSQRLHNTVTCSKQTFCHHLHLNKKDCSQLGNGESLPSPTSPHVVLERARSPRPLRFRNVCSYSHTHESQTNLVPSKVYSCVRSVKED